MRKFRSASANLMDVRLAYTYLIAIALAFSIMGLIASRLEARLGETELASWRDTLTECADSLRSYLDSDKPEHRLASALRFENAAAALICDDSARSALLDFADELKNGGAHSPEDIRALSDTFSLLAQVEYENGETARRQISEALLRITGADAETVYEAPPEAADDRFLQFAYESAEASAGKLLGSTADMLTLQYSPAGLVMSSGNLRAVFSPIDGRALSLLHIRLGLVPDVYFSKDELAAYAARLASEVTGKKIESESITELCGFTAVGFDADEDRLTVILDSHGRLCAFDTFKVKR